MALAVLDHIKEDIMEMDFEHALTYIKKLSTNSQFHHHKIMTRAAEFYVTEELLEDLEKLYEKDQRPRRLALNFNPITKKQELIILPELPSEVEEKDEITQQIKLDQFLSGQASSTSNDDSNNTGDMSPVQEEILSPVGYGRHSVGSGLKSPSSSSSIADRLKSFFNFGGLEARRLSPQKDLSSNLRTEVEGQDGVRRPIQVFSPRRRAETFWKEEMDDDLPSPDLLEDIGIDSPSKKPGWLNSLLQKTPLSPKTRALISPRKATDIGSIRFRSPLKGEGQGDFGRIPKEYQPATTKTTKDEEKEDSQKEAELSQDEILQAMQIRSIDDNRVYYDQEIIFDENLAASSSGQIPYESHLPVTMKTKRISPLMRHRGFRKSFNSSTSSSGLESGKISNRHTESPINRPIAIFARRGESDSASSSSGGSGALSSGTAGLESSMEKTERRVSMPRFNPLMKRTVTEAGSSAGGSQGERYNRPLITRQIHRGGGVRNVCEGGMVETEAGEESVVNKSGNFRDSNNPYLVRLTGSFAGHETSTNERFNSLMKSVPAQETSSGGLLTKFKLWRSNWESGGILNSESANKKQRSGDIDEVEIETKENSPNLVMETNDQSTSDQWKTDPPTFRKQENRLDHVNEEDDDEGEIRVEITDDVSTIESIQNITENGEQVQGHDRQNVRHFLNPIRSIHEKTISYRC